MSRLEHGRPTASADDVGADLRSQRVEYATSRRQFRTGFAGRQRAGVALQAVSTRVLAFEPAMVPGMLQTPDYARHVFVNNATFHGGAPGRRRSSGRDCDR